MKILGRCSFSIQEGRATSKRKCGTQISKYLDSPNATACIQGKSNVVNIHEFDKELYKSRNIIERFFNRIKNFRDIATRYDKLAFCFENFLLLADFMIQI